MEVSFYWVDTATISKFAKYCFVLLVKLKNKHFVFCLRGAQTVLKDIAVAKEKLETL